MNLSEDTIKHLERKAFLRGLERAVEIAWEVADDELDVEERSGAHSVRIRLEKEQEKLTVELGEVEE